MPRTTFYFIRSAMTGFIANVFTYRNRVSFREAFEGLEPDEGKLSRPVLRGPGSREAAWLLGTTGNWRSEDFHLQNSQHCRLLLSFEGFSPVPFARRSALPSWNASPHSGLLPASRRSWMAGSPGKRWPHRERLRVCRFGITETPVGRLANAPQGIPAQCTDPASDPEILGIADHGLSPQGPPLGSWRNSPLDDPDAIEPGIARG